MTMAGNKSRVEAQSRPIFRLRLGQLPATHVQQPEIEMSLRPLGIDHLGGDEFRGGLDQGGLLLRRQRQQVGSGQCPRRFDAHGSNRVAEQRSECHAADRRRRGWQGARRRGPDERARIGDRCLNRRFRGRRYIGPQQWQGARARDSRLALIEDQPIELLLGIGGSDPPGMERGAVMRGGLPPAGIPAGHGLGSPLGGSIGVTLAAGVRRAE